MTEVTLLAGARVAFPKEEFAFVEQQIWIRRGTLHFTESPVVHVLRRGDHLTLGPTCDCTFENHDKNACVYLVMLVRSSRAEIR